MSLKTSTGLKRSRTAQLFLTSLSTLWVALLFCSGPGADARPKRDAKRGPQQRLKTGDGRTPQWYVALDPGHGGKNYGAVDPRVKGRYEKHYTLKMARIVKRHLESAGVKVWVSRDRDRPRSLRDRISSASAEGVDLFVSIHINDAYVVGPRGHGTFFLTRGAYEESRLRVREFDRERRGALLRKSVTQRVKSSAAREVIYDLIHQRAQHESMHLAHIVNQTLEGFSPFGTRGVKQGDYGIIKGITTPAIVCEVGFLNHPREGPFITSVDGMNALSGGVALGVLRYLTLRRGATLDIPKGLTPLRTPKR